MDAAKAFRSIRALAADPHAALPLLREQLKPVQGVGGKRLAQLIADLDSDDFDERDSATDELARLGRQALPALEQAVAGAKSVEMRRRAESLLARLAGGVLAPHELRVVRAIELLEMLGTPDARHLLEALAKGRRGPCRPARRRRRWHDSLHDVKPRTAAE